MTSAKTHGFGAAVLLLAFNLGCATEGSPEPREMATVQGALHSWSTYHWARTSNPFAVKTLDSVTAGWNTYFATTVGDWSLSPVLDLTAVAGDESAGARKTCSAVAGKIRVCNATYGKNGWLGLAQIWLSGGHISQGTAKMNDTYFALAKYNTVAWKNHVMCQEVGHALGLGHTSEDGSSQSTCMDYATDPTNSQHPNAHDFEQLNLIYAHVDTSTTIASTAASSAQGEGDGDGYGKFVGKRGRTEHWVRLLPGGGELHSFVVLAD